MISREVLFGNPKRTFPQISPDGKRLAYIAPDEGVLNVWVKTVGLEDDHPLTHDRHRGVRGYFWARNNRQILFIQDKDGDENWHVYAIPVEGGEAVDLTPFENIQARILKVRPDFPDTILVGINNRNPQLHDVYRLDLRDGSRVLDVENTIGAVDWTIDNNLVVRIGELPLPDGGFQLVHRDGPGDNWKPLTSWSSEDALTTSPAGFALDNETLYIKSSVGTNAAELRTLNLKTGEWKTLVSDPVYDVSELLIHPISRRIQAVNIERERMDWLVLDPEVEADFAALRKLHPGDFGIIDRDNDDTVWLVVYVVDVSSVVFYSYSRATKQGTFLFSHRPELDQYTLSPMKPVCFTARDGLTIHGYLTLPVSADPRRLPAILLIHGGPWVRDTWCFHPEVQWLADRGYAVLQINYRGSTGYGKQFTNAGDKEWGGKMQDDITDAALWLIEQGVADSKRIGIYGGSYGGYATLVGLTKTPDLFRCGVDIVGPSNLITFQESVPPYWEPIKPMLYKRVGHPETDRELLDQRSPLNHIDQIKAPLMIAQGKNDPRVKRAESLQICEALRAVGKTVEYLEFEDEGHGFARPENRLKFYAAAEKFLSEHLGGRYLD